MSIYKYKVLNPVNNTKLPFFDERKGIFYVPISGSYRYYVEAIVPQEEGGVIYFLLLGKVKFDINCRLCHTDDYGRVQIKIKGEMKDFIVDECKERGNVKVEYVETIEDYDVFSVI